MLKIFSEVFFIIGNIGVIVAIFHYIKKQRKKTCITLSIAFLIISISSAIDRSYACMIIEWLIAIVCFWNYLKEKQKEEEAD